MTSGPGPFGPHQADTELRNIADWWLKHTPDKLNGGIIGEMTITATRF